MAKAPEPSECYYFDIFKTQTHYRIKFWANDDVDANARARQLVPDFDHLRWSQWRWSESEGDWKKVAANLPRS